MEEIVQFLAGKAVEGLLPLSVQTEAANTFNLPLSRIEKIALTNNILPARYQRNRETISIEQQLTLCESTVAVIGCGGLGGYVIEQLARIGVGSLVVVDPDVFEEHNLNRQLLCTANLLGRKKVDVAARRAAAINPSVTIRPVAAHFIAENAASILSGADAAVDALDSIVVRLLLADMCTQYKIPLIHGAIAGWYGRVATQFPGEISLQQIYALHKDNPGVETKQGNPSFTPAMIASLEVAEVVKILLKTGEPLRRKYLSIDLYYNEITVIPLQDSLP